MYNYQLHQQISLSVLQHQLDVAGKDNLFYSRFISNVEDIAQLYQNLYQTHPKGKEAFTHLLETIAKAYANRPDSLKQKDEEKERLISRF